MVRLYARSYLETIIQELLHVAIHKCVMQAGAVLQHDRHISFTLNERPLWAKDWPDTS